MSEGLVEWLRLQLDLDEQKAGEGIHTSFCVNDVRFPEECTCGWSARVLREIEAKRKIIDELLLLPHYAWYGRPEYGCPFVENHETWVAVYGEGVEQLCECGRDAYVDRSLRLLAAIFDSRPGYQESWRPA